jgi:hypothetical protein
VVIELTASIALDPEVLALLLPAFLGAIKAFFRWRRRA